MLGSRLCGCVQQNVHYTEYFLKVRVFSPMCCVHTWALPGVSALLPLGTRPQAPLRREGGREGEDGWTADDGAILVIIHHLHKPTVIWIKTSF